MPIEIALTHRTEYRYDRPVTLGPQTIRLRPAPHTRTPIRAYSLKVAPKPHFLNWQQDPQGNFVARVVFPEPVTRFSVTIDLVADMSVINPFDFFLEPDAEHWPFAYDPVLDQELAPFRAVPPAGPLLAGLLAEMPRTRQPTVDMLVALNQSVMQRVGYIVRLEPGVWTPEQTLAEARGSCRDSAWLLVHALRHLGYAARFVSGYLVQLAPDIAPLEGPPGPAHDFTDLHAWAEVYLPGAGWVGLDATSGLMAGEGHIPLAATPEPASAAPVSGLVGRAETRFDFAMEVTRLRQTPRVTAPYTDRQWQDIQLAAERIDQALIEGDARLTLGGEPTFVSATDMEGAEWTIDALGPTKRAIAGRMVRKLGALWAPGAVLQLAQGKHYPGEQLPRWALVLHWRHDGQPVWHNPALLADDDHSDTATAATAHKFAEGLAMRLGLAAELVREVHEDRFYFLWREARLPANLDVADNKLADPEERARMTRVFAQGLGTPVGSVLPLRRNGAAGAARVWQSGGWRMRGAVPFLIPGDAPIGYRLPLASLEWVETPPEEIETAPDPFAPRAALPMAVPPTTRQAAPPPAAPLSPRPDLRQIVRTALAVEPRKGVLHVFLPPLYEAEDWLDLVAAIEAVAMQTGRRVVLEGYPPPEDPRLGNFSITPDPGVIEVNVPPSTSFTAYLRRTEQVYAAARDEGLAAEKFMLDGRHIGTGGGNHLVMGAAEPADSPFLRRPDLLKSLLGFWHNHPSLSYLFSGLFIGPSSQHPRVDEARQDALLELELACARITPFAAVPYWQTDRVFRNILADVTGNTHRTEFCIDKMYAPQSASGRRGLVEFRAFEMSPHSRMAAVQTLLMGAAIASFWARPYQRRLIRWGTRLHDAFMLPHYVAEDLADVLAELAEGGMKMERSWFDPHLEFRFPQVGELSIAGMGIELRHALEPWHALGEEPVAGGTVRYVDSSVERLQARVTDWVAERFVLTCNNIAVPLRATQTQGEYVAGIRFKAWAAPHALHPDIPAQTPLVFDVFDRWSGRSLGGLTYHVAHPGGRSYDRFPVNANSAEARRRSRFLPFGHTPGRIGAAPGDADDQPPGDIGAEHPLTLDLRRFA